MLKTKNSLAQINSYLIRKPSLPLRRVASAHSYYSEHSCSSDRVSTRKPIPQQLSSRPASENERKNTSLLNLDKDKGNYNAGSEKNLKKLKPKPIQQPSEAPKKTEHHLTAFQWLIIMRHCFHIENKRRAATSLKQRTLLNYLRNKVYEDSLWNRILVVENEAKISTTEIVGLVEREGKAKMTIDDIFLCLSRKFVCSDDVEGAAQTARFTQHMKSQHDSKSLNSLVQAELVLPKVSHKKQSSLNKQNSNRQNEEPRNPKPAKEKQNTSVKAPVKGGMNLAPIATCEQQLNNISFSMEESATQSQTPSQSLSSHFVLEQKIENFDAAFTGLQQLKTSLQGSFNSPAQRQAVALFIEQVKEYSIYKNKGSQPNSREVSTKFGSGLQLSGNSVFDQTQYFYGLKLDKLCHNLPAPLLKSLLNAPQLQDYLRSLQALKITEYSNELTTNLPILGSNLRILNLSSNGLRSIAFIKHMKTRCLEFINLNNNKIKNISELLSIPSLEEIHAKRNIIDHISVGKPLSTQLRIIDLGYNQIGKEEDLWSLLHLPGLAMVNLVGNAIMQGFKSKGLLRKETVVCNPEMYIFSAYAQYKDIAFEAASREGRSGLETEAQSRKNSSY